MAFHLPGQPREHTDKLTSGPHAGKLTARAPPSLTKSVATISSANVYVHIAPDVSVHMASIHPDNLTLDAVPAPSVRKRGLYRSAVTVA